MNDDDCMQQIIKMHFIQRLFLPGTRWTRSAEIERVLLCSFLHSVAFIRT